jgi:beta-aspartyl-peptidase (threonine type)
LVQRARLERLSGIHSLREAARRARAQSKIENLKSKIHQTRGLPKNRLRAYLRGFACLALALLAPAGGPAFSQERADHPVKLVIHGGAGVIERSKMTPEREKAYRDAMAQALRTGYAVLQKGGTSLDAVEATIKVLEDSPLFNAGKGAVFTSAGTNELDASIMDGATLNAGAVAGVKRVKNPIGLARLVMEKSPHVMMVGDGAEAFARSQGLRLVSPRYFHTAERWKALQEVKREEAQKGAPSAPSVKRSSNRDGAAPEDDHRFGTVGAVAVDRYGNLAAGTSTGGMTNKRFGRVGDSPIIGAGTYADNRTCGVSATGHGEYFIRAAVAPDISALMAYKGMSVREAADEVVKDKLVKLGGEGGVIAMDAAGNVAMSFNSSGMFRGYVNPDGSIVTAIYADEETP